jgi:hypothetical protein
MDTHESDDKQLEAEDKRKWPRTKCDFKTKYYNSFMSRFHCKIVDMSQYGFGIVGARLPKGAVIKFSDPWAKAKVVWSKDDRAGLKVVN